MNSYLNCLNELFNEPKERTFTDRTEILEQLNTALTKMLNKSEPFQILSIHGIGGIGKTRLVNEYKKILFPETILCVSFEIEKRSDKISNLYQIRKQIQYSCPFFDYALLLYWEMTNPTVLNDSFMQLFQNGFFQTLMEIVAETLGFSGNFVPVEITVPTLISPTALFDFLNEVYRKFPQLLHKDIFKMLSSASSEQLANKLPCLLGIEIKRLIEKEKITYPVFIFDSYQESQPYSESEEWLFHLINSVGQGLFIITSREPIHWNLKTGCLIPYHLKCYPKDDAQILLEETIINRPDLVDVIIESTQCIPIYIDLALNVYEKEIDITPNELIEKSLFHDRHKLVHHFINHLKTSWQSAVLNLATIRVFNREIFEYFINQNILNCAPYEYTAIISGNLFNYVSESTNGSLYKLHDVFCKDVQMGRPVEECYSIYKIYLKYICHRRDFLFAENNGASLAALFQNALYLAIIFEERMYSNCAFHCVHEIEICVVEQLLDIFFTLISNRVRFEPIPFDDIKTTVMKKVCQFVYVKIYEKNNTLQTIQNLRSIGDISCFGKHKLSYEATFFYARALVGHYNELECWIAKIEGKLNAQAQSEWFYNRIKIYQADCDMMRGRFKSALASLYLLKENTITIEDDYSIYRTIGHIQRFNFQLESACNTYKSLYTKYSTNIIFREYLTANLAETLCYFPSEDFINQTEKRLCSMKTPYNVKNKGKILYALGIACTVKRQYKKAQNYINECIRINRKDGYQSGELFAYMAQAYLDFACIGTIDSKTYNHIEHLLQKNDVYTYFRLPLFLMKDEQKAVEEIESTYEWVDFNDTKSKYCNFLTKLRNT